MNDLRVTSEQFCADYIHTSVDKRFVLGTGEYARSISAAIEIAGFIDDYSDASEIDGVQILRTDQVPDQSLVVVASMLRPRSAMQTIKDRGLRALDYFAFERYSGIKIKPVAFWSAFESDYNEHRGKYDQLRSRLHDQESRNLLDNLVRFRMQGDLEAMADYDFDPIGQYFEDFLDLRLDGETFVDVGSFDGQTSLEFAKRAPEFARIIAFEPSDVNRPLVEKRLLELGADRIMVYPYGLGAESTTMRFDSRAGSSSRASVTGDAEVSVVTLDSLEIPTATFVKMDIEGGEVEALEGALSTIARCRPRLAISVYHRATDLWRIPETVDKAGVAYNLYLRHYTEGIDETVMFFIPQGPFLSFV